MLAPGIFCANTHQQVLHGNQNDLNCTCAYICQMYAHTKAHFHVLYISAQLIGPLTYVAGLDISPSFLLPTKYWLGCRDGAVVRALACHQCGPGSIPRSGVKCGLSLLVLYSAPRGFLRGLRFPLSSKTKI